MCLKRKLPSFRINIYLNKQNNENSDKLSNKKIVNKNTNNNITMRSGEWWYRRAKCSPTMKGS